MKIALELKTVDGRTLRPGMNMPRPLPQRPNDVWRDQGRPWAGDLFLTGTPTDPAAAYAHFTCDPIDGMDVEAWLDRTVDGTLTGWVRQGMSVWKYTDPVAWGIDVDGAKMTRVDTPADHKDTADENPETATDIPPPPDPTDGVAPLEGKRLPVGLVVRPKA